MTPVKKSRAKKRSPRKKRGSREPRPNKAKPLPFDQETQAQVAATVPQVPVLREPGRPSDYNPAFCQKIIEHMQQGNSLRSFGAVVHADESTIRRWSSVHPEFKAALKMGRHYLEAFYENIHKAIGLGQLKRIKSETPIIHDGKPVYDSNGKVMIHTEYEPTNGNVAALIFLAKNVVGWKDRREIFFGDDDETPGEGEQTIDELLQETREMMKFLEETQGEQRAIDVTAESKPA